MNETTAWKTERVMHLLSDVGTKDTIIYCDKELFQILLEKQEVKEVFTLYYDGGIEAGNHVPPTRKQLTIVGITFVCIDAGE